MRYLALTRELRLRVEKFERKAVGPSPEPRLPEDNPRNPDGFT
jgi:hypothetical protein